MEQLAAQHRAAGDQQQPRLAGPESPQGGLRGMQLIPEDPDADAQRLAGASRLRGGQRRLAGLGIGAGDRSGRSAGLDGTDPLLGGSLA